MPTLVRPSWQVVVAALLALVVVPVLIALGAFADERPLQAGEPASRAVFADEQIRVVDEEATETARRTAAESVEPVVSIDRDAQTQIVADVRAVFSAAQDVRARDLEGTREQREALLEEAPELEESTADALVALGDAELDTVEEETVSIAQALARGRIADDEVESVLEDTLRDELAVRPLPGETGETIVEPVLRAAVRPTVTVDPDATAAARERAAEETEEIVRVWQPGEAVVRSGEVVDDLQMRAVTRLGEEGSSPLRALWRAAVAMLLVTAVAVVYLTRMQPRVWAHPGKLVLLGILTVAYAVTVIGAGVLTDVASSGWFFAVPAGALAMLIALLVHPVVGIASMLPAAVLVLLVTPASASMAVFAAASVLVSVPLATRIASRSDLRSATLRAGMSYPVMAAVIVGVFGPREELVTAIGAGALNGLITALAVQGALPFLESLFRLPTVTALLDLADRNHPLLRELEQKALGSYNHSVMVASLTERACRAIGADPLLGSVAALYHDIGKVRQPHFFIENQYGIGNPHDELEPRVSARIIQQHVVDGVEMAAEHRLPPEVVACIGSHHGTMKVTYFYEQAVKEAGGDRSQVDEDEFRYHGTKPRSREAATLLLCDCSEAATRAMAMGQGTLPREEIEQTVDRLMTERVDDGQFDESDLTFRQLRKVRDTIVESLVGIYHPRIAYPRAASSPDGPATGHPDAPSAAQH